MMAQCSQVNSIDTRTCHVSCHVTIIVSASHLYLPVDLYDDYITSYLSVFMRIALSASADSEEIVNDHASQS